MTLTKPLLILFFAFIYLKVFSQAVADDHPEEHEHLDHHRHELGVGNSAVYFLKQELYGYGLHLHYAYNIPETRFGVGAGYEVIFTEHRHHIVGITAIYRPVHGLNLNLTPGLAFEGEGGHAPDFALHFEASYEFEIGDFHIGPVAGAGYDPEDIHLGIGLHVGIGF